MSKSRSSDHIDDFVEWGQKQYTPWEYAQNGKLTPFLKAEGNKKRAAIYFFIQGSIAILIIVLTLLTNNYDGQWLQLLIPTVIALLSFLAGANYLRQRKAVLLQKAKAKHNKRR